MARTLFRNAQILDAERGDYLADGSVLVEGDRILEVGGAKVQASEAQSFDLAGLTLLPGLIDRRHRRPGGTGRVVPGLYHGTRGPRAGGHAAARLHDGARCGRGRLRSGAGP